MNASRPTRLLSLVHYHQEPRTQPVPYAISEGLEVVELMTGGRAWVWHEKEWVELLPGALLWHREGDYTIGRSDPELPYSCLAVRMETSKGDGGRRVPRLSQWHDLEAALDLVEESIPLFLDEGFENAILLDYLFSRLRFEATRFHVRREQAGVSAPLRQARALIESRYGERIQVRDIARAVGWSVAHLHDQFKQAFGATPRQELLGKRLRVGRELLVSSGDSVKEIAARTGFTHSSAFCSAFRGRFGTTPKAYRNAYYYGYGDL